MEKATLQSESFPFTCEGIQAFLKISVVQRDLIKTFCNSGDRATL